MAEMPAIEKKLAATTVGKRIGLFAKTRGKYTKTAKIDRGQGGSGVDCLYLKPSKKT